MWVVQELAYSQEAILVCGHRVVDWATIDSLISRLADMSKLELAALAPLASAIWGAYFLNTLRDTLAHANRNILAAASRVTNNGTRLRSLLEEHEKRKCGDPRDNVFALLGLVSCPKSDNLQVDYGNPVSKVFTQATWDIIYDICNGSVRRIPNLDIICWAYRSVERYQEGLPSWVPDWSQNRRFRRFQYRWKEHSPYTAGGNCELASVPPITATGVLAVEGVLWDKIRYVTDGISRFGT
ncbi:hypothetical protein L207DRAFT_518221 [Hyaloscypha variabilis F]|uniref:Heterokaryon incompatibility domain-containing protein n=1 Tax=Hyaloscypha variabilis (strain UAMH 11265 / GT02V1 / F) TaxID=1149755 RepID=A0A2J6R4P7_HYAVF|nr:hypothetical protein L207DRAFT_518221 [Hyaloscypha variabilis F]